MPDATLDIGSLRKLLAVVGGDSEDLIELTESFLETTPDLVEELRAAARAPDPATIARLAHTLKSNARDFGAIDLAALCEALEHDSRGGRAPDAVERVELAARALALAAGELRGLLESGALAALTMDGRDAGDGL